MGLFQWLMAKCKLITSELAVDNLPFIGEYSLLILDSLFQKSTSLAEVKQAITNYPEDVPRESFVRKSMTNFVTVFPGFSMLSIGIEKQFSHYGGRRARRESA